MKTSLDRGRLFLAIAVIYAAFALLFPSEKKHEQTIRFFVAGVMGLVSIVLIVRGRSNGDASGRDS